MHRASALFVGVYEPVKQKLLRIFPESLSAFSHLVRYRLHKHRYEDIGVNVGKLGRFVRTIIRSTLSNSGQD